MHLRIALVGATVLILGFACAQGNPEDLGGGGSGDAGGSGPAGSGVGGLTGSASTSTAQSTTAAGPASSSTQATSGTGGAMAGTGGAMAGTGGAAGSGGASATVGSGGAGGAGGAAAVTVTVAATTTGAGGAGGMCAETPCQLVAPQCGCPAGEECTVDAAATRSCVAAGTGVQGSICGAGMACAAGLICLQTTPAIATCATFCTTNADCVAPGGLCVLTLENAMMGMVAGVTMCSQNCNPITNVGCAAGLSCQLEQEVAAPMSFLTACEGAGTGKHGASCTTSADCAPDFGCFDTMPSTCLKYCNANDPFSCPGVQSCYGLLDANMNQIMLGNTPYGVCE